MISTVVRMLAKPIEDPLLGVNTQLSLLNYDDGDVRPPSITLLTTVKNSAAVAPGDTDQSAVVVGDWPFLVIAAERVADIIVPGVKGKPWDFPNFPVTISYVTSQPDLAKAWRDSDYTLRALVMSLLDGLFASDKGPERSSGSVEIAKHNGMTYGPILESTALGRIVGAIVVDLYIRVRP